MTPPKKPAFTLLKLVELGLLFFIAFAVLHTEATGIEHKDTSSSNSGTATAAKQKRSVRRTIFPGPVTPDRVCAAGAPSVGWDPREGARRREQVAAMWGQLRARVTGDRSKLLLQYAKNLVRNRGHFFSLALQMLGGWREFDSQPGFLYHYVSAASALFSAPQALASYGLFYEADRHYPNWYTHVWFNQTMNRFAPRATRQNTSEVRVDDVGADDTRDYTAPNPAPELPAQTTVYRFQRKNQRGEVREMTFEGPRHLTGLTVSDVYYDCAHGHGWLLTLASPVVDILPRYTFYTYLQKPRNVALATADLNVAQMMSGLPEEEDGFHNMLVPMLSCPAPVPPSPGSGTLRRAFFRSLNPQTRLALRLAHQLSAFLQNLDSVTTELNYAENGITYAPYQPVPDTPSARIKADRPMNDTLLEAEVLSTLLTDPRIMASGVFFEVERVTGADGSVSSTPSKAFQAWRGPSGPVVEDLSQSSDPNPLLRRKTRMEWVNASVDQRLRTYTFHAGIRSNKTGGGLSDFALDPLSYWAVPLAEGYWTSPHYKCDGFVQQWAVTYATPFFGPSVAGPGNLILRGIVTVDIAVTAENWEASD
ncbi:uncharacterized protein LOC143298066 [Babylonia areolata]|uniref:uncharacterized protein LOC143298066 n=1 Tax=Babylonia areolata TaxID=304850 RepID=UPI003FD1619A